MSLTPTQFYQQILSIHTRRAEIYTLLLNETQYINDYGTEQLDAYCKEAIGEFQTLSKSIRQLESQFNTSNPSSPPDIIIPEIQLIEQRKLRLVVEHIKKALELFRQSCPHNHAKVNRNGATEASNWKHDIFAQYKNQTIEEILAHNRPLETEGGDDKALILPNLAQLDQMANNNDDIATTSTLPETTIASNETILEEEDVVNQNEAETKTTQETVLEAPPCVHKHGDFDHDEFQKLLADAKRKERVVFVTELSEIDDEMNDIIDEIRSNLCDLLDE